MSKITYERLVEIAEGKSPSTSREKTILATDQEIAEELHELQELFSDVRGCEIPEGAFSGMNAILPGVMASLEEKKRFSFHEFLFANMMPMKMATSMAAIALVIAVILVATPSFDNASFAYLTGTDASVEEIIYPYSSMELIAAYSDDSSLNFQELTNMEYQNLDGSQLISQDSDYSLYDDVSSMEEESFNALINELDEK